MTALLYEFELYDDAALTSLVISVSNVSAGATSTSWRVPIDLQEDGRYFWRARARDAAVYGAWTMPACAFRVDAINSLPGAPRIDAPAIGSRVATLQPTLQVGNAVDPEQDPLTYDFEVFSGATSVVAKQGVPGGTGSTSWQVALALTEDTDYTWRARAVSAGGPGPWSELGRFRVSTLNAAPPPPLIVSPQNGTTVETLSPLLVFLPGADPDADNLVFDWELAADETFATPLASGTNVTTTQLTLTAPLAEDARSCWRVRSDDGQSQSDWVRACFRVSTVNAPPNVPTPFNPSGGSVVATLNPVFSWATAVDPEGSAVFYDVEVKDGATVVASMTGLGGNTTVAKDALLEGKSYTWRVRATTADGPDSEYSADSSFEVKLSTKASGCGCDAAPGWAFLGLPFLLLRRRRQAVRLQS